MIARAVRAFSRIAGRDPQGGEAFDVRLAPGTADARVLRQRVDELRPRAVPSGARRSGAATAAARRAMPDHRPHHIVSPALCSKLRRTRSGVIGTRSRCPRLLSRHFTKDMASQQPAGKVAQGVARAVFGAIAKRSLAYAGDIIGSSTRDVRDRRHSTRRARASRSSRFPAEQPGTYRHYGHPLQTVRRRRGQLEEEGLMRGVLRRRRPREPIVGVVGAFWCLT